MGHRLKEQSMGNEKKMLEKLLFSYLVLAFSNPGADFGEKSGSIDASQMKEKNISGSKGHRKLLQRTQEWRSQKNAGNLWQD
jgi:hypothetical protein